MIRYQNFFYALFLLSLCLVLIACLSTSDGTGLIKIPYLDKIAHFTMHCVLMFTVAGSVSSKRNGYIGVLAGIGLGILMEILQQNIPGRGFEYYDILANSIGTLSGFVLFESLRTRIYRILDKFYTSS